LFLKNKTIQKSNYDYRRRSAFNKSVGTLLFQRYRVLRNRYTDKCQRYLGKVKKGWSVFRYILYHLSSITPSYRITCYRILRCWLIKRLFGNIMMLQSNNLSYITLVSDNTTLSANMFLIRCFVNLFLDAMLFGNIM
jgi:hypothetical protein